MEKNRNSCRAVNQGHHRVGRVASADLAVLAVHRGAAGWMVLPCGPDAFWLRVPFTDEAAFGKLPLLNRWIADENGNLTREGRRVPEASLPPDGWTPVAGLLAVGNPVRSSPGLPPPAAAFRLEPDGDDKPASGLVCEASDFARWVDFAFEPRLGCLRFACCDDGRVFIAGTPLPPLPGVSFHRVGRLWIPCGYRLPDHVWLDLVEGMLGLGNNRLAVLHPDGGHEEISEENLVAATRGTIRTSLGTVAAD